MTNTHVDRSVEIFALSVYIYNSVSRPVKYVIMHCKSKAQICMGLFQSK